MSDNVTVEQALNLLDYNATTEDFFNKKYYVERQEAIKTKINEIKQRILYPEQRGAKILLCGHLGAGKTTILRRLNQDLKEQGLHVIFVSSRNEAPVVDLDYTDILLLLMKKTLELIKQKSVRIQISITEKIYELLKQLANKEITIADGNGLDSQIVALMGTSSTRNKVRELREKTIIPVFNELLSILGNKVVFIIEHIEKRRSIENLNNLERCLIDFSDAVENLNCSVLLVLSHSIFYRSDFLAAIDKIYSDKYFLPIFQIRNSDGTYNEDEVRLMEEIVRRRIPGDVIPNLVITRSAKLSGGIVREFLEILRACCWKAQAQNSPNVNINMLNDYIREQTGNLHHKTLEKYKEKLNELYDGENLKIIYDVSVDNDLKNMLFEQAILEYKDKDNNSFYGIHPLLLEEKTWWARKTIVIGRSQIAS
jgi:GTPase SAR1 family protein